LAKWSGTLQEVAWTKERRGYLREQATASATAPNTKNLNDTLQDLLDEVRPIKDEVFKGVAAIMSMGLGTLNTFLKINEKIEKGSAGFVSLLPGWVTLLRKIGRLADWWLGEHEQTSPMHQRWAENWRRPINSPAAAPVP